MLPTQARSYTESKLIKEVALYELVARRLWPLLRPFVKRHLSRRCRRCIASEKYVSLSTQGLCPECATGVESSAQDVAETVHKQNTTIVEELTALLTAHQGAGSGQYDAVVCFSGGKDSSLMLHRLRAELPGLRLLALTVDTGFMSPLALGNMRQVIDRLGVDHLLFRPPFELCRKMFAYAFLHLNQNGGAGTVDFMDGSLVFDVAKNLAARLAVPLVLAGVSRYQAQQLLGLRSFEVPRAQLRAKATQYGGIVLEEVFNSEELAYWWDGTAWPEERIPRWIFPMYAWNLEEEYIKQEVVRLGLIDGRATSPLLTNHELIPLMSAVDVARMGYGSFEPEFARMVREGQGGSHLLAAHLPDAGVLGEDWALSERVHRRPLGQATAHPAGAGAAARLNARRPHMLHIPKPLTVNDIIWQRVAVTPQLPVFSVPGSGGWRPISWKRFGHDEIRNRRPVGAKPTRPKLSPAGR